VARHAFSQSVVGWVLWPFTVLLPSRDDPIEHIDMLHLPVLILHSQSDKVVPYEQGQRLYQKWRQLHSEQTLCWQEAKGGHVMSFAFPELRQTTLAFILNAKC
jgi:predicted esterase